jgi:hypothetical protein
VTLNRFARTEDLIASASNRISSPSILISSQKFSFLPKSSHFLQRRSHFFTSILISSQKFSFLHKSSHFFQKVLISSQKFSFPEMQMSLRHSRGSFLQKKSHFLERGRRFSFSWLLVGSADPYSGLAERRLKPDVGTRRHESHLPVTQEKAVFTLSGVLLLLRAGRSRSALRAPHQGQPGLEHPSTPRTG